MLHVLIGILAFVPAGPAAIPEPSSIATLSFLFGAAYLMRNRPPRSG